MTPQMWLENLAAYSVQVAVLILAGAALIYLFRLKAPYVLLAFWQTLLAVCLLLPIFQPWRPMRLPRPPAPPPVVLSAPLPVTATPEAAAPISVQAPSRSIPLPTYKTVAVVLGAGVALRLLWLALGLLRLRLYRKKSRLLSALPESIREMQWRVGVTPEIFLSPQIDTPVTFGWQKPAVLFPESFTGMAEVLQRPIACHELLHVERRDWLHIVFEEIIRSLFWFHPAIWWALGRIHLSREQVVDREVLKLLGERGHYLESLLHIASLRGRPAAVPAPLLLRERHLVQRVALMLKESKMTRSRLIFSLAAIAAFLLWTGTFAAAWFPLTAPPVAEKSAVATPSAPISAPAEAPKVAAPPVPAPKAQPKTKLQEPVRVASNVQALKIISRVDPVYPAIAKSARIEGMATLEVLIEEQGNVSNIRVLNGQDLLNQAAIDAVRQWRYSPTFIQGKAVQVLTTVTVIFKLGGGPVRAVAAPPPPPMAQAPRIEPIRVGGNVLESKLIKRVDPVYPELAKRARVEQIVMLEVTVNEEGLVSNVRMIKGHPLLDQAAVDAVKQWEYKQTLLNGQAVPVIATVTVVFSLSPKFTLGADGYIRDSEGANMPLSALREEKGPMSIAPTTDASFELIQRTLANLQAQGIENLRLSSQYYVFIAGRLFYQAPLTGTSDPQLKVPVLEYDANRLAELAKASGRLPNAVGNATFALNFTVFVDEAGRIVAVQGQSGPLAMPEVENALKQARVVSPGLLNNVPVPMAVRIALRVSLNG